MLRNSFPDQQRILPMIKVHERRARGGDDSPQGLERLRGILNHRIDLDLLAESEAITYLCRACGGHFAMKLCTYQTAFPSKPNASA